MTVLASCTSHSRGSVTPTSTPGASTTTPGASTTTPSNSSTGASGGGEQTVTDAASGTSITITVGARLRVVLRSTYWEFGAPPAGGVLVLAAEPTTSVDSSCIPGGGCGVVSEVFTGVRPGQVHIVASRTTCGEAFACTGSQGRFDLTVAVSA